MLSITLMLIHVLTLRMVHPRITIPRIAVNAPTQHAEMPTSVQTILHIIAVVTGIIIATRHREDPSCRSAAPAAHLCSRGLFQLTAATSTTYVGLRSCCCSLARLVVAGTSLAASAILTEQMYRAKSIGSCWKGIVSCPAAHQNGGFAISNRNEP